ncbi:MAG TPA: hypothetical protein QGH10_04980, partial [Armatimonadota bacterium]|nr:hypothetical protein [Armatimonadota bacterium]
RPTRLMAFIGLAGVTMAASGEARGEFRHGGIYGPASTLQSIAAEADDPGVFHMPEDKTVVVGVSTTVHEQFTMGPGEKLLMAGDDWGMRTFYVKGGPCDWTGCTVEGAYWLDVGADATGTWRDVTIRAGAAGVYPVVWFRSPALDWDGGLVDCFPAEGEPANICIGTRSGYQPGPFTNTIRNVTFRTHSYLLLESVKERHDVDLTFENCVFETTGDSAAIVASPVNVADACRSVFTFRDCIRRHDGEDGPASSMIERGEIQLSGSAVTVRFEEGGEVTEIRRDDLIEVASAADTFVPRFVDALAGLRPRVAELSADERLRGTLAHARESVASLELVAGSLENAGWYGEGDVAFVDKLLSEIRDTVDKAPLTIQAGSPYNPISAPLDPSTEGEASIEAIDDAKLRVQTQGSEWVYFRNPAGDAHATFLAESHVRGRPIVGGAYPELGGPSVRTVAPISSANMLWEYPWETRITRERGKIVAFETEFMSDERYGVRATWVFFQDLPEVILCNARSIQNLPPDAPYGATYTRLQAYAQPELGTYNGARIWGNSPDGVRLNYAPTREHIDATEPEHGFFVADNPSWYYTTVSRGLVLAQWGGFNHWETNPPCGYVVRKEHFEAAWTSIGGYYGHVVQILRADQARDADDLNNQILWFEGAGLKCWENIYNLDAAFNHPCRPLLDLTDGDPGQLTLWEADSIDRGVEIVVLPRPFAALESPLEWYRGDVSVTLLRDVAAGSQTPLGTLPIEADLSDNECIIRNADEVLRDVWLRIPAADAGEVKLNGEPVTEIVSRGDWSAFMRDLPAGESRIEW